MLSFALNLFFFTYPLSWTEIGFDKAQLWQVYSIIFLPSVLLVFPYMRRAEKAGRFRRPIMIGWSDAPPWATRSTSSAPMPSTNCCYTSAARRISFGYSVYQPMLPAFLTQQVPAAGRGTASGVYNSFGFIGSSLGGMLGGALSHVSPALPEFDRRQRFS